MECVLVRALLASPEFQRVLDRLAVAGSSRRINNMDCLVRELFAAQEVRPARDLLSAAGSRRSSNMDCVVPNNMSVQLLEDITDGFSEHRMIGYGSCGKVYMGVHKDGTKIAVKLFHGMPGLNDGQFQNEFNNLKRLDHPNIVRLVGCCHETKEKLINHMGKLVPAEKRYTALCLEYMNNGSLDNYISDEYNGHSWSTRYKIIKGICEGIKYLHGESKPPIYHLDLKPANVLLDENMLPKISDFGLSKIFGEKQTQIIRNDRGTDAYSPPEYKKGGVVSMKFDIFSLGVVIMKIMAGRKGYCRSLDMSPKQFIELVCGNWRNRLPERSECGMEIYSAQIKTCIEIAVRCVEYEPNKRPNIGDIVNKLNETETNVLLENSNSDFLLSSLLWIAKFENSPPVFTKKNKNYSPPVRTKRLMEPQREINMLWEEFMELIEHIPKTCRSRSADMFFQNVRTKGILILEIVKKAMAQLDCLESVDMFFKHSLRGRLIFASEIVVKAMENIEYFERASMSFRQLQHVHQNGRNRPTPAEDRGRRGAYEQFLRKQVYHDEKLEVLRRRRKLHDRPKMVE